MSLQAIIAQETVLAVTKFKKVRSEMSLRITVVAINFFPEETGCGPYTTDFVNSLSAMGHSVKVLTGLPHYPQWTIHQNYRKGLYFEENFKGVLIRRFWHYVPKNYSTLGRIMYELTFFLHLILRVRKEKADIVLAVSPSLLSIVAGRIIRKKSSRLKVLVQDLMASASKQTSGKLSSIVYSLTFWIEKRALRFADQVGIISDGFISYMKSCGIEGERITVTENYSLTALDRISYRVARREWGWSNAQRIVLYTGSLGRKQNLDNLIEAAKYLFIKDPNIKILLFGDGNARKTLQEKIEKLTNVEIRDLVPVQRYMSLLCSADLLISHEGNIELEMSVPSKLTSYLSSGRPILVVCSETSSTFRKVMELSLNHSKPNDPLELSSKIFNLINSDNTDHVPYSPDEVLKKQLRIDWITS